MENNSEFIENYIKFINENIAKFEQIGDLVRDGVVPLDKVYKALANYYNVCLSLNSLYQQSKIEKLDAELLWEEMYAGWFSQAKESLYSITADKRAKPALKEIEQEIIAKHKLDYFVWKRKLATQDAKCDFFIRLRETLNKYDGILTALASSMRCEMRALGIEERAEANSEKHDRFKTELENEKAYKLR